MAHAFSLTGAGKYQHVEINVQNWVAPYWKIEKTRCWTVIDVNLVFSQLKLKARGVFVAHYANKYLRFELVLTVEQKFVQSVKTSKLNQKLNLITITHYQYNAHGGQCT